MGCIRDGVAITAGVPPMAADLMHRPTRQPWAITSGSLIEALCQWLAFEVRGLMRLRAMAFGASKAPRRVDDRIVSEAPSLHRKGEVHHRAWIWGMGLLVVNDGKCYVARIDVPGVRPHELAHCNGWARDHPGGWYDQPRH